MLARRALGQQPPFFMQMTLGEEHFRGLLVRVMTPWGTPIEGAKVSWKLLPEPQLDYLRHWGYTKSDGTYFVDARITVWAEIEVEVEKEGYKPRKGAFPARRIRRPEGEAELSLTFPLMPVPGAPRLVPPMVSLPPTLLPVPPRRPYGWPRAVQAIPYRGTVTLPAQAATRARDRVAAAQAIATGRPVFVPRD